MRVHPNTFANLLILRACYADISCSVPGKTFTPPQDAQVIQSFFEMTFLQKIARTCAYHEALHVWLRSKNIRNLHELCTRE